MTTVSMWTYAGAATGTHSFAGLGVGDYVARAFAVDSYELIFESQPFSIVASSVTVEPSAATYALTQPITVSWSGTPGNANDWIAIAPDGSELSTVTTYVYTGGTASGSHQFAGFATGGTFVVRAFLDNTYTLLAQSSSFTVAGSGGSATVGADSPAYAAGAPVTVSWAGLPGGATDWVAIAPQGSPASTVARWAYTGGAASGSVVMSAPAGGGAYVARAFPNDSYVVLAESAVFTVGLEITTDASTYALNVPIVVSWNNLPGNATDWVAIAPEGSSYDTIIAWVYAPSASGSHQFAGLGGAGNYVARAFLDNSYSLLGESAPFSVGAGGTATVGSDASSYTVGQDIVVSWSSFPGNALDWVAIAPEGSSDSTVTRWAYTGGAASGSVSFTGGVGTAGNYVVRGFLNDSYTKLAESNAFTVSQ
ncbi:MAG: hypothetical protein ACKV2T_09595 [Kofleriaceae bacterium]